MNMETASPTQVRPAVALKPALKRAVRRAGLSRGTVASVRMCAERNVIARTRRDSDSHRGRILCYHSVGTPEWGLNDVSPARFALQIDLALDEGFRFVPAERIARGEGLAKELAITFDDGLTSVKNAVPVLSSYRIPFTLFVVSQWADGRNSSFAPELFLGWQDIEAMCAQGATVGSHSVTHPNFGRLGPQAAQDELAVSRETIASRLGMVPTSFAIPFGQSHDWTAETAAQARTAGYETVYAQAEDSRPAGTVPRTFITRWDTAPVFRAALAGKFASWEEWV
jgi:peptidoglycan/xylan/chitin deacetylase (PgdA/CDA1 family)